MNKRDIKLLEDLYRVAVACVAYCDVVAFNQDIRFVSPSLGSANYHERERHARSVLSKAFTDFKKGIEPQWFDYVDPDL